MTPAHPRKTPPLILVADDNEDTAELIVHILRKAGCRVIQGHDGRWALESARRLNPQLAILNNLMPHICGIEVAERLRKEPKTSGMRIIVTSASDQAGPLSLKRGADAFIAIPFRQADLLRAVKKLLAWSRA